MTGRLDVICWLNAKGRKIVNREQSKLQKEIIKSGESLRSREERDEEK